MPHPEPFAGSSHDCSEQLQKAELLQQNPAQRGWVKVQGSVDPRFTAGLSSQCPEILDLVDVSDFFIFFCSGRGKGESEVAGGGVSTLCALCLGAFSAPK